MLFFIFICASAFFITTHFITASKSNITSSLDKGNKVTKPQKSPQTAPTPVVADTHTDVVISSVGDCTLGTDDKFTFNTMPAVLKKNNNDYSYFFKNVSSIFKSDDFTTANLETTLTNSNKKRYKGSGTTYNFKASPDYAKALTSAGIDSVNISNNHIYDYGDQGISDTIATLNDNNIKYFGEGHKLITEIKGIKFGFLGYTGFSDSSDFLQTMKNDIQYLKSQNCIVILNIHWGVENQYKQNAVQTHIAHTAIDSGADLIIGHHPHVVENLEVYKGKLICYSLGNFCFGGNSNPSDKDTFIIQSKFSFTNNNLNSYSFKLIPCSISSVSYINDYCPTPMSGNAKINFLNKINSLSSGLNFKISDDFYKINVNN